MEIKVVQDAKSIEADILLLTSLKTKIQLMSLPTNTLLSKIILKANSEKPTFCQLMEKKSTEKSSFSGWGKNQNLTLIK